jgi:hypothetical protein
MHSGAVSTSEQREEIIESCNSIEDWLYEDGRQAELSEYKSKQSGVKVKAEAIFKVWLVCDGFLFICQCEVM